MLFFRVTPWSQHHPLVVSTWTGELLPSACTPANREWGPSLVPVQRIWEAQGRHPGTAAACAVVMLCQPPNQLLCLSARGESGTLGTWQLALDKQVGSFYPLAKNPCPKPHTSEGKWASVGQQTVLFFPTYMRIAAEVRRAKEGLWLLDIQLLLWVTLPGPE